MLYFQGASKNEWFDVNVSYEPRWIIYFAGLGNTNFFLFGDIFIYKYT